MLLAALGVFFHTSAGDVPDPVFRDPLAQHEAEGGRSPPFLKDEDARVKRRPLAAVEVAGEDGPLAGLSSGDPDTSTISQHVAKARSARIFRAIRIPKASSAYDTPR